MNMNLFMYMSRTAKIEISPNIKLIYNKGIKANDIKKAITIANEFSEKIIEKWHEYFDED